MGIPIKADHLPLSARGDLFRSKLWAAMQYKEQQSKVKGLKDFRRQHQLTSFFAAVDSLLLVIRHPSLKDSVLVAKSFFLMSENEQAKWLCENPSRFNDLREWLKPDHPLLTIEQFVADVPSWKDADMKHVMRGIMQLHLRGCMGFVKNLAVKSVAQSFGCLVTFLETAGLPDKERQEHLQYSIRLLKQLFWWKIAPQTSSDDDPSDIVLESAGFADALRSALKPHLIRPGRNRGIPEFVTKLSARLWSAEDMPKAKDDKVEGEGTPGTDKGKGDAAGSGLDAGAAAGEALGGITFSEGDSVICSAKKNKAWYDGQTATIIKLLAKGKVKIMMTSGDKKDESRTVDAKTIRPNETMEETRARQAANARALFGETI
jgi:hypothetical protein